MSSNKYHLDQDQPGLELAPEPELPQVVEGPTIIEKSRDGSNQYAYEQQQNQFHQGAFPNAYSNGAYPASEYPQHAGDAQGQPYWRTSQDGTYVTDGFPPSSLPPSGGTILGLKKRTFWLIFGPLIAILILGLALGLGIGLGTSHDNSSSSSDAAPA